MFEFVVITTTSTIDDNKSITKDIAFSYSARGFYCPSCSTGVSLDTKTCQHCGQSLRNPYEYIRGNNNKSSIYYEREHKYAKSKR